MSSIDASLESSQGRTGPADDRPLTPEEYQLLQRLLSDPFSLPIQFKTWLISYLETSDLNLPISAIQGLTSILGIAGVAGGTLGILPAGLIFPYGGSTAPTGSKMCDGTAYSRTTDSRLYAAIGTAYGAPDAASFNVPDMRARFPIGLGTNTEVDTLGKNDGVALGSRKASHKHIFGRENVSLTPGGTTYAILGGGATRDQQTDDTSSGMTNKEPFLVVNFIIVA